MRKLELPDCLKEEFATVKAVWDSGASTSRVDALLLSWIKYEKQLRRLFCYLLYQHGAISEKQIDDITSAIASNNNLYPPTFIAGIEALGAKPLRTLLDGRYNQLFGPIKLIKKYRNKLMHGQITGKKISSQQLERDVLSIIAWVSALAEAAENEFGYDGIKRNTFRMAKAKSAAAIQNYPFQTLEELKQWVVTLAI
jgi:hypothetical protein